MVPKRQRQAKLGRAETRFYAGVWILSVFYSIYRFYHATDAHFKTYIDTFNDFKIGWSFLDRKLDVSDEEWTTWIPLIYKLFPWIIVHVFISQCLKQLCSETTAICIWYISVSLLFLWYYFGLLTTLCTLLLPCISCLSISLQSKSVAWFLHCLTIVFINWTKESDVIFIEWLRLKPEDYSLLTTALCWVQLRSISYCIDSIETYKHIDTYGFLKDLLKNVAYCLYLPTLFLGPVILYQQFLDGINKPFTQWDKTKILTIGFNLIRYIFWMIFTQFCLHYFYFNALTFQVNAASNLSPWEFYGFGYCMGQFFLNKYVVIYGLAITICKAEDIDAPPQPKCIGRIHLYSDMWKHFDRGLYKFLLKYIYIPCNPKSSFGKLAASALCFSFIFVWHGLHYSMLIWSFFNFLGLFVENIVKSKNHYFYQNILNDSLSLENRRRLECVLISPLIIFSAISNFYFLAGYEIGDLYISRFFHESWIVNFILLFILYCCCQTCTEIKQREEVNLLKVRKEVEINMYKRLNNF